VGRPLIIDAKLSDFEKIGAPKHREREASIQAGFRRRKRWRFMFKYQRH
jgi:hypothetical protein